MWHSVDLVTFENIPELDADLLFDLNMKIITFKRLSNPDFELINESKASLLDARREFDNALMEIRHDLEPEENEYIRANKKTFDWLIDNLSRFDKRLDQDEKEIMDIISRDEKIGSYSQRDENFETLNFKALDASTLRKLNTYKRELDEAMENLIYLPLKNAIKKFTNLPVDFKDKNGMPAAKDKKLFNYFLFCYLFHSSNMLGGLYREENPKAGKNSLSTSSMTSGTGIEMPIPPSMPENLRIKEKDAAFSESLKNFFGMPEGLKEEQQDDGIF